MGVNLTRGCVFQLVPGAALLVSALGFWMACGTGVQAGEHSDVRIVRGRSASGFILKHTVGLSWNNTPESSKPFCTATIISAEPPLALTAAHCAQRSAGGGSGVLRPGEPNFVYFGPQDIRPITRAVPNPDWTISYADVAVVEFKGPLPSGFEPVRIADSDELVEAALAASPRNDVGLTDADFVIAGWGVTTTRGSQPEALLTTEVRLWKLFRQGFGLGLLSFESPEGNGACFGDSGGPAFYQIDGQWQLVGVTHGSYSAFLRNLPRDLQGNCDVGKSLYTSAPRFKAWILEVFPDAKLLGQSQPYTRWAGTKTSGSFDEACSLGDTLVWDQWVTLLNLILEAGTDDCAKAKSAFKDGLPASSSSVGESSSISRIELTSGSPAVFQPELLPEAPALVLLSLAGAYSIDEQDLGRFFATLRERLPALRRLKLRKASLALVSEQDVTNAARQQGITLLWSGI